MHCLPNLVLRLKSGGEGARHRWLTDFGREDRGRGSVADPFRRLRPLPLPGSAVGCPPAPSPQPAGEGRGEPPPPISPPNTVSSFPATVRAVPNASARLSCY